MRSGWITLSTIALVACGSTPPQIQAATNSGKAVASTGQATASSVRIERELATGLRAPWGLAFLPDGSALVGERDSGRILRIRTSGAEPTRVGRMSNISTGNEGGLLGLAVQPGANPRWGFAYTTTSRDNRILRIAWDGKRLGSATAIVKGIPRGSRHNGGRLVFGPDGMLYVSTGDTGRGELAQRRGSLAGKVLRMTAGGRPAPGNPWRTLVWSIGHRNVEGLAFDASGRLFASELGEQDTDELNIIRQGRNYGWPLHEGPAKDPEFEDPVATWSPTSTASPSGIAATNDAIYVAMLAGKSLWRAPINEPESRAKLDVTLGRIRTIASAPDGSLWLITNNTDGRGDPRSGDDRILKIRLS